MRNHLCVPAATLGAASHQQAGGQLRANCEWPMEMYRRQGMGRRVGCVAMIGSKSAQGDALPSIGRNAAVRVPKPAPVTCV